MRGGDGVREGVGGLLGGWVQIKPSSGGLTCLECVSEPTWLRDRHSALGLWKLSATSRRCVCSPHTQENNTNTKIHMPT